MIHTRYPEKPFLRASPHYCYRAERKERVTPVNPVKTHASSLVHSATCLDGHSTPTDSAACATQIQLPGAACVNGNPFYQLPGMDLQEQWQRSA
jgi:hypothetical protein